MLSREVLHADNILGVVVHPEFGLITDPLNDNVIQYGDLPDNIQEEVLEYLAINLQLVLYQVIIIFKRIFLTSLLIINIFIIFLI